MTNEIARQNLLERRYQQAGHHIAKAHKAIHYLDLKADGNGIQLARDTYMLNEQLIGHAELQGQIIKTK